MVRRVRTDALSAADVRGIRQLLAAAFDDDDGFSDEDWQHAVGGCHFVLSVEDRIRAHAAVVERELHVDRRPLRAGYVEAVATEPARQRSGLGTLVMRDVAAYIRECFDLGALSTGSPMFYERLGWMRWRGPTFVRTREGVVRTPEEDGAILVLATPSSPALDVNAPISCEWRPGDVW